MGIKDLQCCNSYFFLSDFSFKFQSFMTLFHYKNARMENIPKMNELKISWNDNICSLIHEKCHLQSYHGDTTYH